MDVEVRTTDEGEGLAVLQARVRAPPEDLLLEPLPSRLEDQVPGVPLLLRVVRVQDHQEEVVVQLLGRQPLLGPPPASQRGMRPSGGSGSPWRSAGAPAARSRDR